MEAKREKGTGRSKGYGFIEFADHKHALRALRGVSPNLNANPNTPTRDPFAAVAGVPSGPRPGTAKADPFAAVAGAPSSGGSPPPAKGLLQPRDNPLAAVTGARRSELAGLRWAAVDGAEIVFDRQIVVDREHPDAEPGAPVIREDATKTGARRRVTVDAETASLLDEARVGREELAPWLFSDTDGPPNPDRVSWWWKRAREESGIDDSWRLHDLRHWSATQAIAAGYDVQTVARRLGHADATTTLRVYSHAIDRSDPALAEDLGKIMKRRKRPKK